MAKLAGLASQLIFAPKSARPPSQPDFISGPAIGAQFGRHAVRAIDGQIDNRNQHCSKRVARLAGKLGLRPTEHATTSRFSGEKWRPSRSPSPTWLPIRFRSVCGPSISGQICAAGRATNDCGCYCLCCHFRDRLLTLARDRVRARALAEPIRCLFVI